MAPPRYTPGSPQAKEFGCTCPDVDNCYGQGIGEGNVIHSETRQRAFYVDIECPYHGEESQWRRESNLVQ